MVSIARLLNCFATYFFLLMRSLVCCLFLFFLVHFCCICCYCCIYCSGLPLANASLLDESTAAAEAMAMCFHLSHNKRNRFFVDDRCHPQNVALVETRGAAIGLEIVTGTVDELDTSAKDYCGVLIQYPDTYGYTRDWTPFVNKCHNDGTLVVAATDLMASVLLKPGKWW